MLYLRMYCLYSSVLEVSFIDSVWKYEHQYWQCQNKDEDLQLLPSIHNSIYAKWYIKFQEWLPGYSLRDISISIFFVNGDLWFLFLLVVIEVQGREGKHSFSNKERMMWKFFFVVESAKEEKGEFTDLTCTPDRFPVFLSPWQHHLEKLLRVSRF